MAARKKSEIVVEFQPFFCHSCTELHLTGEIPYRLGGFVKPEKSFIGFANNCSLIETIPLDVFYVNSGPIYINGWIVNSSSGVGWKVIVIPNHVATGRGGLPFGNADRAPSWSLTAQDDHDGDTGGQKLSSLKLEHNHSGCG